MSQKVEVKRLYIVTLNVYGEVRHIHVWAMNKPLALNLAIRRVEGLSGRKIGALYKYIHEKADRWSVELSNKEEI